MTDSELDEFFPRDERKSSGGRIRIGTVTGGSLSQGLAVRLDAGDVPGGVIEGLAVGRYVVLKGLTGRKFFSIVTDIALDSANPALEKSPPEATDPFLMHVYRSTLAYGRATVAPMLVLESEHAEPKPVKTIPAHFSPVLEATDEDVSQVFGAEDADHFHVGSPLDMEGVKVNLNLDRFIERSSGVFGKSGTGKSFITRTILTGVVQANKAACLVFDMHNDYGWEVKDERGRSYKGLRQLFETRVSVFTLDERTSRHRGSKIDGTVQIAFDQIEPEDVDMLSGVLALSEVQQGALYYLRRKLGRNWFQKLLEPDAAQQAELENLVDTGNILKGTLGAIQRKLEFFRRMDFIVERSSTKVVDHIFHTLNAGKSVVLEFGNYGDSLPAYIFVANYLTRRIHARYVDAKNKAAGKSGEDPNPLMIVIEEAHKFLDPEIAGHTIFGTIARELRKYNVTLLIVDQRPSGIDDEVMSQIGTRVTCLLDNEADIRAVFSGVSGASALRQVLARLDTQQQALIMGHAVPMPVVIRTREYGPELYAAVGYLEDEERQRRSEADKSALFGD
ncbi:MAG: ATP-binding protein [Anaerolineales bacterium]